MNDSHDDAEEVNPKPDSKTLPLRTGVDEMMAELILTAYRREDELDLPPPASRDRFAELIPGREYRVLWRHHKWRQRIMVDRVFPDPKLPMLQFRIVKESRQGRTMGPTHYLPFVDLADFESG